MKRVAIMQPTYLPWMGYFGLMTSVDLFVILDCVQFAKRSWQQRNQIKTPNGPLWLSVPVFTKGQREQLITEVKIDYNRGFPVDHYKSLEMNYKKTKFFEDYASQILSVFTKKKSLLPELTIDLIYYLKQVLNINTPIKLASELEHHGNKADLLASLCEDVGANIYVSPPGSQGYLDQSDAFEKRKIPIQYFNFTHPVYPQKFGAFLPYMSVIDLLFNCGQESFSYIYSGCKIQ